MTVIINYPPVERATDDVLSRKDAARYLGVDVKTLDRMCRDYSISRVSAGRRVLLRRADLDALFQTRKS